MLSEKKTVRSALRERTKFFLICCAISVTLLRQNRFYNRIAGDTAAFKEYEAIARQGTRPFSSITSINVRIYTGDWNRTYNFYWLSYWNTLYNMHTKYLICVCVCESCTPLLDVRALRALAGGLIIFTIHYNFIFPFFMRGVINYVCHAERIIYVNSRDSSRPYE